MEIGFQMNQLAGTGCIWSLFRDFAAEFLDGFADEDYGDEPPDGGGV